MLTKTTHKTDSAYQWCLKFASAHYENFPVASLFLPKDKRLAIAAIYVFARLADDIVDEGTALPNERIAQLDKMAIELNAAVLGNPSNQPVYIALADSIKRFSLPPQLFLDLLIAFTQDVTKERYQNFDEVMAYCQNSANPVGRLLLHLHEANTAQNQIDSDKICSALQLINFLQDIVSDYHQRNRIYLPQDEMAQYGVTDLNIANQQETLGTYQLIQAQINRAESMLHSGAALIDRLSGRFKFEIVMIVEGGQSVINALRKREQTVFSRPSLSRLDFLKIIFTSLKHMKKKAVA